MIRSWNAQENGKEEDVDEYISSLPETASGQEQFMEIYNDLGPEMLQPDAAFPPETVWELAKEVAANEILKKRDLKKRNAPDRIRLPPNKKKSTKKRGNPKKPEETDSEDVDEQVSGRNIVSTAGFIFDPEITYEPEDEWLIFEMRYDYGDTGDLIFGPKFVPTGSEYVKMVVVVKVSRCFAYSFERADLVFHGQVNETEKANIEATCKKQKISFLTIIPNNRLFPIEGLLVAPMSSSEYHTCFDGLQLDVKRIYEYLKQNVKKGDVERGTIQKSLGYSVRNWEKNLKTEDQLKIHPLDAPHWTGTEEEYENLSPLLKDLMDRMQDFVDVMYPFPNKQLNNPLRYEQFAQEFNKRMGCERNRFEAVTVAIAILEPRTNTLKRHVDRHNDHRQGYTVTVVWSCCCVVENAKMRLSVILYTRKPAGLYFEKTSTYVAAIGTKIDQLLAVEHYRNVKNYALLDLAEEYAMGNFGLRKVWDTGDVNCVINCLAKPMHFDPCSFLSVFAWCIHRLRVGWQLSRTQVVELLCLSCIQNSAMPFAWLTEQLLSEGQPCIDRMRSVETLTQFLSQELKKRVGRNVLTGGTLKRHQPCMGCQPGMVSKTDHVFTEVSVAKYRKDIEKLEQVIDDVGNRRAGFTKRASNEDVVKSLKTLPYIAELNCLKVMPLAALVGLVDVSSCFKTALHGELPRDKGHAIELKNLGCDTASKQAKYIQSLNESMGQPRDFFFHGDHVLCMTQGHCKRPSNLKWDVFFPGMPLLRLKEDREKETVRIVIKKYGSKEWVWHNPTKWTEEDS